MTIVVRDDNERSTEELTRKTMGKSKPHKRKDQVYDE